MDVHFNAYKVKFDLITHLLSKVIESQPLKTLNIFISIDNVFSRMRNTKSNSEFQHSGEGASKQLMSNVLNLIGHYRQWGVRQHLDTKVYGYYTSSDRGYANRVFIRGYRSRFAENASVNHADSYYVNQIINKSESTLKTIFNYIDGVYLIDSRIVEPSAMPLFIQEEVRQADLNIVVSRDAYDFQYACFDKFLVLYPKGDDSVIINGANLWDKIADREKFLDRETKKYPAKLYPLAIAAMGDKHRSIPKIKRISWMSIFNFLDKSVSDGDCSYTTIAGKFLNLLESKYTTIKEIENNFACADIRTNYVDMDDTVKELIKSQLIDIPDYDNLLTLNKLPNMFLNYPINLKFLTDIGDAHTGGNPFLK